VGLLKLHHKLRAGWIARINLIFFIVGIGGNEQKMLDAVKTVCSAAREPPAR
jgi:hypothetical protein